ncbi:MAG: hydrogenase iron-sulfur subunit [Planctomycetota bacterium]|jgi:coenzyme F420-reducing hydrogenase delta subunit
MEVENFEPVIVAFCCHYCAYTAADMAGSLRLCYPPNVKIIRVPCAGKVDAVHIMRAFQKGADGVYVAGCLEGDCHFKDGNIKAARRVKNVKRILDEIGIGGDRVEMVSMSAGMGERFAQTANEITERIRQLGPNPIKKASMKEAL